MSSLSGEVEKIVHMVLLAIPGILLVSLVGHHQDLQQQLLSDLFPQHSVQIPVGVSGSQRVCVESSDGSRDMDEIVAME